MNWKNSIKLVGRFDRSWDSQWENKPQGAQIGYTVQARLPPRQVVYEGQALQQQPIINQTVPITLNHQYQVGLGWSSADDALVVEEVQRYTKASATALANKADVQAGAEVYKQVYYSAGTPGVAITSDEVYTDAVAKLRSFGVPEDLCAVITPQAQSKLLAANFALFGKQYQEYFSTGQFSAAALGVDEWYWDPNMPSHTTGVFTASTPLVNGASQTGSTLVTDGWGTYALKAGDIFTINGVNGVNPLSYIDSGLLQEFVLVADLAGASTGTLTISPPIITSGQLQTVTASPADNAQINYLGSTGAIAGTLAATVSKQGLLFNGAAFAFVMADLPTKLPGAVAARKNDAEAKLSMRFVEQYNIQTDQMPSRMDMIVGVAVVLPYFALRTWG